MRKIVTKHIKQSDSLDYTGQIGKKELELIIDERNHIRVYDGFKRGGNRANAPHVFIQDIEPKDTDEIFFWVETGLGPTGDDATFWFEDGKKK